MRILTVHFKKETMLRPKVLEWYEKIIIVFENVADLAPALDRTTTAALEGLFKMIDVALLHSNECGLMLQWFAILVHRQESSKWKNWSN